MYDSADQHTDTNPTAGVEGETSTVISPEDVNKEGSPTRTSAHESVSLRTRVKALWLSFTTPVKAFWSPFTTPVKAFWDSLNARSRAFVSALSVLVVCFFLLLAIPVPYVAEMPGITVDVLGGFEHTPHIITIKGAKVHRPQGHLRMTTVGVRTDITFFQAFMLWQRNNANIIPKAILYPPNKTDKQVDKENKQMFTVSENSAAKAAIRYLHLDPKKVNVAIDLPGVGGPSAGLMLSLGVVSELSEPDLLHGLNLAGTGTINPEGIVGVIGGITMKLAAAKRDGVKTFFVPAGNCAEARTKVPEGMTLIRVGTLSDAVSAIKALEHGQPPVEC